MQQCDNCLKIYDESDYAKCPYCNDADDDNTYVIVYDKEAGEAKSVPKSEAHLYD